MKYIKLFEAYDAQAIFKSRKIDMDFLNKINIPENSTILDVSYGNGRESKFLSEHGHNVHSTELTDRLSNMLGSAHHHTHNTKEIFPFENDFFDVIFSRLGLHYFTESELGGIFSELNRMIKNGGSLSFTVKIEDDAIKTGKIFISPDKWKSLVENNGFNVINLEEKTGKLYEVESKWIEVHAINNSVLELHQIKKFASSTNRTRFYDTILDDPTSSKSQSSSILLRQQYLEEDPDRFNYNTYLDGGDHDLDHGHGKNHLNHLILRSNEKFVKLKIKELGEDNLHCEYCDKNLISYRNNKMFKKSDGVTVDHKEPMGREGDPTSLSNKAISCYQCNEDKKNLSWFDWLDFMKHNQDKYINYHKNI